jgi:Ca2+-transporting ATPase
MQTILSRHWHHLPEDEVLDLLETDPESGLDVFEVAHRQERFGPNILSERKGAGPVVRFLLQFHQPLVYILLAAGAVTAFLQQWADSGVIFGVVLVNAGIGFGQEAKALKAIEALARAMTSEATVVRKGERERIPATELVPGDIVLLRSGDKVPADIRLFRTRELQIDESALTGESVPVEKRVETLDRDTVLADRRNMAYSTTLVTYGTGAGVVVGTGDSTEIGRISELIASAQVLATPLTRKIAHFSGVLLYVILAMAAVTFLVGTLYGESWFDMFMAAVALAVGAIPEALPAALTITLAIGVARMARIRTIIRRLPAVETLGGTTVICSDKTGTLTQNQMTVQEVMAGGERFAVTGVGYAPEGAFTRRGRTVDPQSMRALSQCLTAGLLCNDSRLVQAEGQWRVEGDPTEGALIGSALKAGLSREALRRELPRIDTVPFESQRRYMATLHDAGPGRPPVVYLKGSVESLLSRCRAALDATGELTDVDPGRIHACVEEMAAKGLRVLGFARTELPVGAVSLGHEDVAAGLTFLGLQGMNDPPRPEAVAAVQACRAAGIRVKMITGDHVSTGLAIARRIGLDGTGDEEGEVAALIGKAIAELSDAELIEAAERTAVFARVSPEQKLRLVEALQSRGNIVAVTGDGVNDAPALRQADIGIAMGITGTEVAKEAADMVLTDDNFASIEAAIEEGRGVFDNIVKFITWTLPTNIGEGLVIMAAVFAGVALPILPVQILWINMTTAVLLGLMLAFEPKEPGIMSRPPRDPWSPILTRPLVFRICLVGLLLLAGSFSLFEWALSSGASDAYARTVAVNVFVMGETFYLFNCRSLTRSMFTLGVFTNRWVLGGVAAMFVLQMLFTYAPTMNDLFHSAPIGLDAWGLIIAVGICIYAAVGAEKWFRQRYGGSRPAA